MEKGKTEELQKKKNKKKTQAWKWFVLFPLSLLSHPISQNSFCPDLTAEWAGSSCVQEGKQHNENSMPSAVIANKVWEILHTLFPLTES